VFERLYYNIICKEVTTSYLFIDFICNLHWCLGRRLYLGLRYVLFNNRIYINSTNVSEISLVNPILVFEIRFIY
jgi:hypothetical protein